VSCCDALALRVLQSCDLESVLGGESMSVIAASVQCDIPSSFRVQQVAGMFDVPITERSVERFEVEVPDADEAWEIGAIVGPSGSGKTTVARSAFGDAVYAGHDWRDGCAVVDGFGSVPIRQVTHTLTAVGFSSPPSWIKPYAVLSNGEQFRCDLARALLLDHPLVVFDEFTSVVDRTVAKVGSAAVSRAVRSGRLGKRLVAVTCHYDVLQWLEPDWVVDMATRTLTRGCLRRPRIRLQVVRCAHTAWEMFARHHYLSGSISRGATCYLALWANRPVAFCAVVGSYGHVGRKRVTRIVTLPDYQGIGIGARLLDYVAAQQRAAGFRISIRASHPAVIGYCKRSSSWRTTAVSKAGDGKHQYAHGRRFRDSIGRSVVSFEYIDSES